MRRRDSSGGRRICSLLHRNLVVVISACCPIPSLLDPRRRAPSRQGDIAGALRERTVELSDQIGHVELPVVRRTY